MSEHVSCLSSLPLIENKTLSDDVDGVNVVERASQELTRRGYLFMEGGGLER